MGVEPTTSCTPCKRATTALRLGEMKNDGMIDADKEKDNQIGCLFLAEGERFELSIPCGIHAFQACALGHYATLPDFRCPKRVSEKCALRKCLNQDMHREYYLCVTISNIGL